MTFIFCFRILHISFWMTWLLDWFMPISGISPLQSLKNNQWRKPLNPKICRYFHDLNPNRTISGLIIDDNHLKNKFRSRFDEKGFNLYCEGCVWIPYKLQFTSKHFMNVLYKLVHVHLYDIFIRYFGMISQWFGMKYCLLF